MKQNQGSQEQHRQLQHSQQDTQENGCCVVRLCGAYGDAVVSILAKRGYKLGKTIGEGSYCKVKVAYRATELGYTQRVACKVVNKKKASKDFVSKFLPREISIVRTIHHPHIVTVFNIIEVDDQVYMFMDMCERGDLLDYIRSKGCLSEPRARLFFRQLVFAMEYLHSRDIAHRDMKCENVLMASRDCVKIADFGFARWCCDRETSRRVLSDTFCGSAAYAAPEILQGIRYNPKMYDVWSLGCILYIMLCASMPFDDSNIKQMLRIQLQKKLNFPARCTLSSRVRRLIMHILEPDVTKRATIRQVAVSGWLNNPVVEYSGGNRTQDGPGAASGRGTVQHQRQQQQRQQLQQRGQQQYLVPRARLVPKQHSKAARKS